MVRFTIESIILLFFCWLIWTTTRCQVATTYHVSQKSQPTVLGIGRNGWTVVTRSLSCCQVDARPSWWFDLPPATSVDWLIGSVAGLYDDRGEEVPRDAQESSTTCHNAERHFTLMFNISTEDCSQSWNKVVYKWLHAIQHQWPSSIECIDVLSAKRNGTTTARGRYTASSVINVWVHFDSCKLATDARRVGVSFQITLVLTRHFRSVPACARTLAAQQRWSAPQPAMGSKLVSEAMPYDSMIPYIDTYEPVLPERAGWAMTDATMQALRQTSAIDWRLAEEPILKNLEAGLRELPLHYTEFDQVIQAQLHYYEGNELACQKLHAFATSFRSLFGEVQTCTAEPAKPSPDHLKDLDQLEFGNYVPPLRGHPRFHYILHLFAGAKRDGDLHSCLDQVPCEDGAMFFPISLDVILDPDKGDLLNSGVQAFWLDKTLRGLVYATVAGTALWDLVCLEVEAIRRRPRAEASTFCCRSLLSDMVVESSQDPRAQADICGKPTLTVQLVDDGCALRDQHAWYLGASFGAATQAHWYSSINLEASCGTIDAATPKYLSDPYQAGIFWGKGPKAYDVDDCRTTFCEGIYDSGDTTRKDNKPTSTTASDGPHRERFCYPAFEKVPSGIVQSYSKCTTSWTCRSTISLQWPWGHLCYCRELPHCIWSHDSRGGWSRLLW